LTLAEVLAALSVLSIGLVAMVSLLPLASFGIHEGAYRTRAAFLASERLEQVRQVVGAAERGNDPLDASATSFPDEPAVTPPHAAFSRSVRVRDCGLPPGCSGVETAGVRQVTVTVTYPFAVSQGASSSPRGTVVLSTYIGPR
jgi:Tfp pilus assembly protein PilV